MGFWSIFKPAQSKVAPSAGTEKTALLSIVSAFCQAAAFTHGVRWQVGLVANTNSMLPLFDENSVTVLEQCSFDDLTPGDVVVYNWSARGITPIHRLGEKDAKGNFIVYGENNAVSDNIRVTRENFMYRLAGVMYCKRTARTNL